VARQILPLTDAEINGDGDVEDLGEIPFIAEERPPSSAGGTGARSPEPPAPDPGADEGPGHARKGWAKAAAPKAVRGAAKAVRVTAGIRADINAKISMPLEIGGRIWQARDSLCGGTFVQQRPEIAYALTDIICDSADLVAFFTGPVGGFMKYLNLGAALWPVVEVGMAHHVYHSIALEDAQDGPGTPQASYAA
jgi:hypothetical protein